MKYTDVAIAIVNRRTSDGELKVLICQRKAGGTFADLWEFPGGQCEPNETPEDCLVRELREELAIVVRPTVPFIPIEHPYPTFAVRLHPFLCTLVEGEPQPLQCQQAIWIPPVRLREYPFPPANRELLERIIECLSRW